MFLDSVLIVQFLLDPSGSLNWALSFMWLVLASLFFYGWWNPIYLVLIVFSMLVNYALGVLLGGEFQQKTRKLLLIFGIIINLGLLAYFKYANFFLENVNSLFFDNNLTSLNIILLEI